MDMRVWWSGFATALALVVLIGSTVLIPYVGGRLFFVAVGVVSAAVAAGLSHDARRTP